MVKTKQTQVIDAQNYKTEIIYFEMSKLQISKLDNVVIIEIISMIQKQVPSGTNPQEMITAYEIINTNTAVFKLSKFMQLYGNETFKQFGQGLDQRIIDMIVYINSYDWNNNDQPMEKHGYWNLTANDLEIVV